jgi:hypothetical protein
MHNSRECESLLSCKKVAERSRFRESRSSIQIDLMISLVINLMDYPLDPLDFIPRSKSNRSCRRQTCWNPPYSSRLPADSEMGTNPRRPVTSAGCFVLALAAQISPSLRVSQDFGPETLLTGDLHQCTGESRERLRYYTRETRARLNPLSESESDRDGHQQRREKRRAGDHRSLY